MRNSKVNRDDASLARYYLGRRANTSGVFEASDEKVAIGAVMKTLHVSTARLFKIKGTNTDASEEWAASLSHPDKPTRLI